MTIKDPEHHFITSHCVYSSWQQRRKEVYNQIRAICMTKKLARDSEGKKLLMVFINCNAAESFICLHLETLEKI